eukprot:scaffold840_cov344-Pavlova_lutheri.AAC.140
MAIERCNTRLFQVHPIANYGMGISNVPAKCDLAFAPCCAAIGGEEPKFLVPRPRDLVTPSTS